MNQPNTPASSESFFSKFKRSFSRMTHRHRYSIIIIILCVLSFTFFCSAIHRMNAASNLAYTSTKDSIQDETQQSFYDKAYKLAEQKHHVSQNVLIQVEDLKKEANLQVLKVYDTVFSIVSADERQDGTTSWLKIPGYGTFVVDLEAADFIVDSFHHHVSVRVPKPSLNGDITIDYSNVESLLFDKKGIANGSISHGTTLAQQQIDEGETAIERNILKNPEYATRAQDSAAKIITQMVKALNPEVPDLTVEIEFLG